MRPVRGECALPVGGSVRSKVNEERAVRGPGMADAGKTAVVTGASWGSARRPPGPCGGRLPRVRGGAAARPAGGRGGPDRWHRPAARPRRPGERRRLRGRGARGEPTLHLLVNNAGARWARPGGGVARRALAHHVETNVLGTARMCRPLIPALAASGDGHMVNLGSIAGFETYAGGAGYTAAKHAERALTRTLRLELLGRPVRVTDVAPGWSRPSLAGRASTATPTGRRRSTVA